MTEIPVRDLHALREAGEDPMILDVRRPDEFNFIRAEGVENVPLETFDPDRYLAHADLDPATPVYFICRSGKRSAMAALRLAAAGHENVVNVTGGTIAWHEAGLPTERGPAR